MAARSAARLAAGLIRLARSASNNCAQRELVQGSRAADGEPNLLATNAILQDIGPLAALPNTKAEPDNVSIHIVIGFADAR
jgi:hypothetical protein